MTGIKKEEIKSFIDVDSSALTTVRTLMLFGRNTATYKFALCHALTKQPAKNSVSYDDLRDDFLKELLSHYRGNPHQFNSGENIITKSFDIYLAGSQDNSDWDKLIGVAEKSIYRYVFDAFQNVGSGTIANDHLLFEHDKKNKRLHLTDSLNSILESKVKIKEIEQENQARWRLVEEAWKAGLSPNLLVYDEEEEVFYSESGFQRTNLRSAVDVLMPYQKGKCFYCKRPLNRLAGTQEDSFPDVDHFLPFSMAELLGEINPNGVWNLVIACASCNRGTNGKFDSPPDKCYFSKLMARNSLFVEEHKHSLKNSILLSLNSSSKATVLQQMQRLFKPFEIFNGWRPRHMHNE